MNDIQDTLARFPTGWFHVGTKKPKDPCYVGHDSLCGCDRYVSVYPEGLAGLSEFTLAVLKLNTVELRVGAQQSPTME